MRALLCVMFLGAGVAAAQTSVDTTVATQTYQQMKITVQSGQDVDWRAFRTAAAQAGLRKGGNRHHEDLQAFWNTAGNNLDAALAAAQAVIDQNMADPEGHFWAGIIYEKMQRPVDSAREKALADALIKSIANSGDGKTKATAFFVVDAEEESFFTKVFLGEAAKTNAVKQDGDNWFDEQVAIDWSKSSHTNWFQQMLGPETHEKRDSD